MVKKAFMTLCLLVVSLYSLVACQNVASNVASDVLNEVKSIFESEITTDIVLPKTITCDDLSFAINYETDSDLLRIVDETDGYLLRVDKTPRDVSTTITVSFVYDGQTYEEVCDVLISGQIDDSTLIVTDTTATDLNTDTTVSKGSYYNDYLEVVLYIVAFNELPDNYYDREYFYEHYNDYTPENMMSCAGGRFYNREGLLPSNDTYYECDILYQGGGTGQRGSKRVVYSLETLCVYYTDDHYNSFVTIYDYGNSSNYTNLYL